MTQCTIIETGLFLRPVPSSMSNGQSEAEDKFMVQPPFDDSSPGDCIIQSIDGVRFKALRQILVLASSVMDDMFSLPQGEVKTEPQAETADHLPIITLDEYAETIHNLLILLYPTSVPNNLGVQGAIKLASAYDKYFIPKDRLRLSIGTLYSSKKALKDHPLELYKLAWDLEMKPEAKTASRFTHCIPFKDLYQRLPLDLLEQLLELRRRREEALDDLIAVLEPSENLCSTHGDGGSKFFSQIAALKTIVRRSIQDPYPEERSFTSFFDQSPGYPPRRWPVSVFQSRRASIPGCDCFVDCNWIRMSSALRSALQSFPQCI